MSLTRRNNDHLNYSHCYFFFSIILIIQSQYSLKISVAASRAVNTEGYQRHASSNERLKLKRRFNNRSGPIYRRRNPNSPPVQYSVKKGGRLALNIDDNENENASDHPFEKIKKAIYQVNVSKSKHRNLKNAQDYDWYDPHFSLDDFLESDWFDNDDTYNPLLQTTDFPVPSEELKFNWDNYRPIRIKADVRHLLSSTNEHSMKSEFLEYQIIPAAIQFWTKALMVYPAKRLFVDSTACRYASAVDFFNGITGVDLMLYAFAEDTCNKSNGGASLESLAGAASCDYDQYDRPIGGVIKFCYDSFKLNRDGTSIGSEQLMIDTVIHEIGHVLGVGSEDFVFYWDRLTGQPRTPRPVDPSMNTQCITGKFSNAMKYDIYTPDTNTLRMVEMDSGAQYYEVVTPTVKRVAKNHYNCDQIEGLRLENQPTSDDCFGQHWEERFAWDENMSAMLSTRSTKEYLSPFTLALLEDSGWYRANYSMANVITFGHGASCDFMEKPCIVDNAIPEYSKGYFCNSTDKATDYSCDPSRSIVALCDMYDLSKGNKRGTSPVPPSYQYFDKPTFGAKKFQLADFCPMYIEPLFSCQRALPDVFKNKMKIFADEEFGDNSRCIDSNYHRPLCLKITCDDNKNAVIIHLKGRKHRCSYDGEKVIITDSVHFECPRRATVCPNSICPANCSGRGVCQWNLTIPSCKCFDKDNKSKNCNDYAIVVNPTVLPDIPIDDIPDPTVVTDKPSDSSIGSFSYQVILLLPLIFVSIMALLIPVLI